MVDAATLTAWLARDVQRLVLCELKFGYESAGAPAEGTVYLSNLPYMTRGTDTPPHQAYHSVVRTLPRIERSINPDSLGGISTVQASNLVLDNLDGSMDFLADLDIDGREARFYFGDPSWARSDMQLWLVATMEVCESQTDEQYQILLRDQRLLLDRDIAGDVVNDERRKPLVFCTYPSTVACSIEPVEKNGSTLEYYLLQNYFNGSGLVNALYDNGVPLNNGTPIIASTDNGSLTANAATDTLTYAAHGLAVNDVVRFSKLSGGPLFFTGLANATQYWVIAAGLTANDFRLSTSKGGAAVDITGTTFSGTVAVYRQRFFDNASVDGTITLSAAPAGRIVADVNAYSPSQQPVASVGELMRALMVDYGGVAASSINTASFQTDATSPGGTIVSAARVVLQRENLSAILNDLGRVTQMYITQDHQGVFRGVRLNLSAIDTVAPDRSLAAADLLEGPSISNVRVITGTAAVLSNRNNTVSSYGELAASVAVATRRQLAAQFRESAENTAPTGTAYAGNWQLYHKTVVRKEFSGAFAQSGADITGIANEILGDLKPHIKVVRVKVDLRAYEWLIGDVVRFAYPRHGFVAGRNCKIIGIATDLNTETVELTMITRATPNTTTASY